MSDDVLSAAERAQLAIDGELDAAGQIAFERDLARSPELAAEYARLIELRKTLRAHAPREAAPERLRAQIVALADAAPPPRRWPWALAAAAVVAACLAAGVVIRSQSNDNPALAALVAGYQRAALSGQPFDVASSDRHTVKPWLAARAPLGAFVPDLAEAGYPLVGGRIDIVDRRPVPTMVYRRREHLISVSELPLSDSIPGSTALDGYHLVGWRDRERSYVAISDIDTTELAAFVALFRRAASD